MNRIGSAPIGRECKHPTCGSTCRREKKEPVRYVIPKVAEKRKPLLEEYKILSQQYRKDNPRCELKLPGCTKHTQGVQHLKGKVGKDTDGTPMLIAVRWWKPACNHCNGRAESHDAEARAVGAKLSKFNDHETNV